MASFRVAPIPAIRGMTIGRLMSTLVRPSYRAVAKSADASKATSDCIRDCSHDNVYPGLNLGPHEGRMRHSDDVSIRRFREPDLCQLVRLINETIGISYAEVYPPRAVQFLKDFHSEKKIADRSKTGTTLVIEENGELVATGSLVGGEIFAVFVLPRLQKGGRGKVLMKALENEARANGVMEIGLAILLPSRRFYESLDYNVVEEKSIDVREGQRLDFWKAVKQLSNS
jgi:N-acetylglutamate synthase-like GNAT family acetyltransferase